MDERDYKAMNEELNNEPIGICCEVLEKMQINWMKFEDGSRCMPYIRGISDSNMYRVNYCPSCGKYIRSIIIQ